MRHDTVCVILKSIMMPRREETLATDEVRAKSYRARICFMLPKQSASMAPEMMRSECNID